MKAFDLICNPGNAFGLFVGERVSRCRGRRLLTLVVREGWRHVMAGDALLQTHLEHFESMRARAMFLLDPRVHGCDLSQLLCDVRVFHTCLLLVNFKIQRATR